MPEELNINGPHDINFLTSVLLGHQLSQIANFKTIDAVYGVPRAGSRVAPLLANYIHTIDGASCKGALPGAWKNVVTVESPSVTSDDNSAQLHFAGIKPGMNIVLGEDVIASGNTLTRCIAGLREAEVNIVAVASKVVKEFQNGVATIEKLGVPVITTVKVERITPDRKILLAD